MPADPATEALVQDVLSNIRAAADEGDPQAAADLAARAGTTTPAVSRPRAPETEAMVSTEREITRPNGEVYHVRKIDIHDDVMAIRKARAEGASVLLTGLPGTGKTALLEAALACDPEDPGPIYTVQCTGDTVVDDYVGGFIQDPDTETFVWVPGPLQMAMERGRPFYLDEIALPDPKVNAVVYSVMDGRGVLRITQNPRLEPVVAQPGFFVCAATNPNASGAHMDEPLLSRFPFQAVVTTDVKLAKRMGVDQRLITSQANLASKVETGKISWAPQMREMLDFMKMQKTFGTSFAVRSLINKAPEGKTRDEVKSTLSRQFAKGYVGLEVE
jgi:nitric oxide reductase NorQ protein